MHRRLVSLLFVLVTLVSCFLPWTAGSAAAQHSISNWNQRDRAVYVVSTLNVLHCRSGRLLSSILEHKYAVTHYDVYADQQVNNLYFIEPRRDDGSSAGALAYQMGWVTPLSVSSSLDKLHVRHAPSSAFSAYRNDQKQMIGSFASTVPS